MANASSRDARAGFDIYRAAGGEVPLDELNARLVESGYGPVSRRMWEHYGSLLRAGYNRYVSINRFDVARASVPYENASAVGRYDYREVDLGVVVVFAKADRLFEAGGRAVEAGEAGAMLRFEHPEIIDGLRRLKLQRGNMVTVRYLETGRSITGRVLETDLKFVPANVEIEYAQLVSIVEVGIGRMLPVSDIRFVLEGSTSDAQTFDLVSRRLYHFFELVEGLRSLVNGAGSRVADQVYAEPPILTRLAVASPAQVILQIATELRDLLPVGLAGLFLKAVSALPQRRKEWYEGTGQKQQNKIKALEMETHRVDLASIHRSGGLRYQGSHRNASWEARISVSDAAICRCPRRHFL